MGIKGFAPLATWPQMLDGTLTLVDVQQMHRVLDDIKAEIESAANE